jgi:hypothetical protein
MAVKEELREFYGETTQGVLTFRELGFTKVYMETFGNATEAAWQVYDCSNRNSAKSLGYKVKKRILNKLSR